MAGTTRDALSVEIVLRRGVVRLIDIAGLEEALASPGDIETQMQEIAARAIEQSDVLVLVRESTDDRPDVSLPRPVEVRVLSKADLLKSVSPQSDSLCVSAVTGMGMDHLREALDRAAFGSDSSSAALALTSRHLNCLDEAIASLIRARQVRDSAELLAAELRHTLDALGQILGAVTPDDILGRIFSKFCIGK
jgi:tRNA modification GTPase